jgi:hypothetical protein
MLFSWPLQLSSEIVGYTQAQLFLFTLLPFAAAPVLHFHSNIHRLRAYYPNNQLKGKKKVTARSERKTTRGTGESTCDVILFEYNYCFSQLPKFMEQRPS